MELEFTKLEFLFFLFSFFNFLIFYFYVRSKSSLRNLILGWYSSFTNSIFKKQSNLLNTFSRILFTKFFSEKMLLSKFCLNINNAVSQKERKKKKSIMSNHNLTMSQISSPWICEKVKASRTI